MSGYMEIAELDNREYDVRAWRRLGELGIQTVGEEVLEDTQFNFDFYGGPIAWSTETGVAELLPPSQLKMTRDTSLSRLVIQTISAPAGKYLVSLKITGLDFPDENPSRAVRVQINTASNGNLSTALVANTVGVWNALVDLPSEGVEFSIRTVDVGSYNEGFTVDWASMRPCAGPGVEQATAQVYGPFVSPSSRIPFWLRKPHDWEVGLDNTGDGNVDVWVDADVAYDNADQTDQGFLVSKIVANQ